MPRRRVRTRTRYIRSASRRSYRGGSSMGGGLAMGLGGLATGALQALFGAQLGQWSLALPAALVGVMTDNEALYTIAGFETGKNLVGIYNSSGTNAPTTPAKPFGIDGAGMGSSIRNLNLLV